jgi:hypothetical protein|tara:strand:+ start:1280 stop:1612 length:333 start_codon:yes stop_codon:yes gene_type:complete
MLNKIYSVIGHFFLRRTDEYWDEQVSEERMSGYSNGIKDLSSSHQRTPDMEPSFNIRIYSAKGGRVVECHTSPASNSQFKSNSIDLYVIPDGTELVDELGKILMMHSLTK